MLISPISSVLIRRGGVSIQRVVDGIGRGCDVTKCALLGRIHRSHHPVPIPTVVVLSQRVCAKLKVRSRFDCHRDLGGKIKVDSTPLREINVSARQFIEPVADFHEVGLGGATLREHRMHSPSRILGVIKRKTRPQVLQPSLRANHARSVSKREKCIRLLSYEAPLDGRSEKRNDHGTHCAHSSPRIPIHRARTAEPPTLAHPIEHRHSNPLPMLERILPWPGLCNGGNQRKARP